MYVIHVIPLARTAPPEPLTYRSRTEMVLGSLVEVSLRKQTVLGLVVSCESVAEQKSALKTASFSITKSILKERGALPPAIRVAAQKIAEYHATTVGAVLGALVAPIFPEDVPSRLSHGESFSIKTIERIRAHREEAYEKIISKERTMLVVPTIAEAKSFAERFKAHKPLILTSALTPKKRDAALAAACMGDFGNILITTPSFAFLPIPSLEHIIVERMSAGGYILPKRPYVDVRYALTELARARELTITYGDYPLPLEYRSKPRDVLREAPEGKASILDARELREEGEKWNAVPRPIRNEIEKVLAKNETVGVLAARRGYSPSVVCHDCGTTVTDEYGRTLSLSIANGVRIFRSADGTTTQDITGKKVLCKKCGSWNLQPLGIGIERVEEELRTAFPSTHIIMVDQNTTPTKFQKVLAKETSHGRLILGTEAMLPVLSPATPLELGVIASADSLLALPFWRARERFVRIGLMLRERSARTLLVTRQKEDTALSAIEKPTDSCFWQEEYDLRKLLNYPPFSTLVAFQSEGSRERVEEVQKYIAEECMPYSVTNLPIRAITKNTVRGVSILQVPKESWPDTKLSTKLAFLPPYVRIQVDSETFF